MSIRLGIWAIAGLMLIATELRADILRVESVSISPGSGIFSVGVFLQANTTVMLGGYDIPLNFGAPGPSALPSGFTFVGVNNSIFISGSTLALDNPDPTNLGDIVVHDATTSFPPSFPSIPGGTEARLFDLRFNAGSVAPPASFSINPIVVGHIFFNLNDSTAQPIPVTGVIDGSVTVVPEPGGLMAVGLFSCLAFARKRHRV